MKKLNWILALGLTLCAMTATAELREEVISKKVVELPVDLSTAGIRLSNAGYGTTKFVKILIPQLADHTLMNHRNEGESAPCVATFQTFKVEDVVQGNPEVLTAPFTIEVTRLVWPDTFSKKCFMSLRENISANVRGFEFIHERQIELPERSLEDCR
ncbi:hypothetical protein [Bdellovibrio reynosensis]|uniref:Uncharacterized protein n=1 Tax=Bdellovibrio reynosensis TaxID=2835041 RepID=A0ABY4CDP0_9BACT|nr:hypothetical protein [Bdellovibrio reynosensis]UOF02844.1 hypothetical protein MNR06_07745 [Bdellovibrio reynosensis]